MSGYEYLDKIVQIPFAIPPLVKKEKVGLCQGYLTGRSAAHLAHLAGVWVVDIISKDSEGNFS